MSVSTKPVSWKTRQSKEGKEAAAWIEGSNPLRGMTIQRATAMFDASRRGDTVHLQWLYNEIEASDPTLLVCTERRSGALVDLDWKISKRLASRVSGYDENLAAEQAAFLESAFGRAELNNLTAAKEHLSLAMFRGFAHVAPLYTRDGLSLTGFDILDNWNFTRDIASGEWRWNPNGTAYSGTNFEPIPRDELCSVVRPRHIDYPAMSIYLRSALGEKAWGKFIDRYGIPPVIIVMPPDIPTEKETAYMTAAEDVADGASGALPNQSTVSYANEARGVNPFSVFLDHQQKLVVLMATGGLATSLETAQGLGSGTSDAHSDTWRAVWRRDSIIVSDAFNRSATRLLLDRAYPGRPHLAYFDFDTDPTPSASQVFDDGTKARSAGYTIVQAQLEEKTGYKLVPFNPGASNALPGAVLNSAEPREPVAKPLQKRLDAPRLSTEGGEASDAPDAILRAFAKDMSPAGKAVAELLAITDPEELKKAAAKLAAKLPELLASDPEMSAVVEESLAESFAETVQEEKTK